MGLVALGKTGGSEADGAKTDELVGSKADDTSFCEAAAGNAEEVDDEKVDEVVCGKVEAAGENAGDAAGNTAGW